MQCLHSIILSGKRNSPVIAPRRAGEEISLRCDFLENFLQTVNILPVAQRFFPRLPMRPKRHRCLDYRLLTQRVCAVSAAFLRQTECLFRNGRGRISPQLLHILFPFAQQQRSRSTVLHFCRFSFLYDGIFLLCQWNIFRGGNRPFYHIYTYKRCFFRHNEGILALCHIQHI